MTCFVALGRRGLTESAIMEVSMEKEKSLIKSYPIEYWAYSSARKRCNSKTNKNWKEYGGRGICFLFWSFADFLKAVGNRPSPKHVLDRKDNDSHYMFGNVCWSTESQSNINQRLSKRNKSGHKGVTFVPSRQGQKKWMATICRNHIRRFLGWFRTSLEALQARTLAEGGIQ